MAKRKTRKQKAKTAASRKISLKNSPALTLKKDRKLGYEYDPKLIIQDLIKTIAMSGVVLGGQLILYFFVFK